jgi:hypothetical protein
MHWNSEAQIQVEVRVDWRREAREGMPLSYIGKIRLESKLVLEC